METNSLVPAAQYVRMSTEDQQYSIANQEAAIRTYAEKHGFVVTSSYADTGKSGVAIKHRRELRRLLHDVMSGQAQYKTILVYDVSRWGRFQDIDEAAHYEFLCRSAGIPVHYCAEQFDNDGSLNGSMMKALKRTMAAEYSRELGTKVSAGQRRLTLLGFRVVGDAGYGLRRMTVSPDGRRRIVLNAGERKAIKTDRTILVPGPKKEVQCVRTMFALAASGRKTVKEIAKELNRRHMRRWNGKPWDRFSVHNILTKEKYIGCNTYGKTTRRLCSPSRKVERDLWTTNPGAFVPIVGRDTFNRAQNLLQSRTKRRNRPDGHFLRGMRKVLAREGKLTQRLLKEKRIFDYKTYYKRFGSILKAYELAGYRASPATVKFMCSQKRVRLLRDDLYLRLKTLFSDRMRFIRLPGQLQVRPVVEIDGRLRVGVCLCRATRTTNSGEQGWLLRVRPHERHLPALICTMDPACSKFLDFYVFPPFGASFLRARVLRENQPWFAAGRKLDRLDDFCNVAREVAWRFENNQRCIAVDDILLASDTWTIMLGDKEIALGPVGSAIFNMLAVNAGQVVTRYRLLHSVYAKVLDPANLNAHICSLRMKLGPQARKRIQRVPGVGYVYVSPSKGDALVKKERPADTAPDSRTSRRTALLGIRPVLPWP